LKLFLKNFEIIITTFITASELKNNFPNSSDSLIVILQVWLLQMFQNFLLGISDHQNEIINCFNLAFKQN